MTHEYLLGNADLHARFIATTQILAKLVSRAPRALSISQLESETGRPAGELGTLCDSLGRAGVLCRDGQCLDGWRLAGEPSQVTLEDVFRCIVEQQVPACSCTTLPGESAGEVDLLLMQAMIAINQSVSTQLRRFSLDRVRASGSAPFPLPRRFARTRGFEEEATQNSPVHLAA